jgi:lipopolysaccharide biosynthesis regulator YciM
MAELEALLPHDPGHFLLTVDDYTAQAQAARRTEAALRTLSRLFEQQPGVELLRALCRLQDLTPAQSPLLDELLSRAPSLPAVQLLLESPQGLPPGVRREGVLRAVDQAAAPMRRHRCNQCGFEAQRHFWQCPGCLSWDSFPPRRGEPA